MLLGLLSDSHDNAAAMRAGLEILARHSPDAYLHAGDLVSPPMLDLFPEAGIRVPVHLILGNNEYDVDGIAEKCRKRGLHFHGDSARLEFAGKSIGLTHGDNHGLMKKFTHTEPCDFLIHGHTHLTRDEKQQNTRIINPGALHRARVKSVALLNLEKDHVQFLDLPTRM